MNYNLLLAILLFAGGIILSIISITLLISPFHKLKKYKQQYPLYFKYKKIKEELESNSKELKHKYIAPIKIYINNFERFKIYLTKTRLLIQESIIEKKKYLLEQYINSYNITLSQILLIETEMNKISNKDLKFKKFVAYMNKNNLK